MIYKFNSDCLNNVKMYISESEVMLNVKSDEKSIVMENIKHGNIIFVINDQNNGFCILIWLIYVKFDYFQNLTNSMVKM